MSDKKAVKIWKRAEYLLIRKRRRLKQQEKDRELILRCYQIS